MKSLFQTCAVLLAVGAGFAQTQAAPTVDEMQYFRFVLMSLASLDHSPDAVQHFEDGIVRQFGLDKQELAALRAASNELNALLKQLRQSARTIAPGRSGLTPADKATLNALSEQRERKMEDLAKRILNSVRPIQQLAFDNRDEFWLLK